MPYIVKVRDVEEVGTEREYAVGTVDLWETREKVEQCGGAKTSAETEIKRTFKDSYVVECRKIG
jgi:hypothetical protein